MKIVLIGDFSALHLNLKKGFESLGHECILYSNGDGFKKIPGGQPYGPDKYNRRFYSKPIWAYEQLKWLKSLLEKHDIVQLMNPHSLNLGLSNPLIKRFYVEKILNIIASRTISKTKFGIGVAGCSSATMKALHNLPRSPCPGCLQENNLTRCVYENQIFIEYENKLYQLADCIIPFGGGAYQAGGKGLDALPMPIDCDEYFYEENLVSNKIRILHGINRPGFKGSKSILGALSRVSEEFSNTEVVIVERMPYEAYWRVAKNCNIIVDQLFGDGLGMNALISMSLGRIVLTSYDQNVIKKIYGHSPPAIDIYSEDSVYHALKQIITSWSNKEFMEFGRQSRQFIEKHCNAKLVARKVLDYYAHASSGA